jgi:uracil-DNA glycosylase family 4
VLTDQGWVAAEELLGTAARVATGQGLSELARDVICGSLLGDGHLNRSSAYFSYSHSSNQRDYAVFKAALLAEFHPKIHETVVSAVAGGAKSYEVVQVRTLAHRSLRIFRLEFYAPGKVVPRWLAKGLTERMLAIWFMDDGYMRIREGGRRPRAEIATNAFSRSDLETLVRALGNLGLGCSVSRGRLQFNVGETERLADMIAPLLPASMRYKLPPAVRARVPFDPSRYLPGPQAMLYDDARAEDITDRRRSDRTFFCIDVKDTHNFVTSGGVVHNCRPPGNRDPLPDEIEECTPWLLQQVELIEPRVIVTLGNFATKFILDTRAGISRVRGEQHTWRGRIVLPTFHPAAVLHGGGDASPQMAALREDLAAAASLLADAPRAPEEQLELF